jgi:sialidase-1
MNPSRVVLSLLAVTVLSVASTAALAAAAPPQDPEWQDLFRAGDQGIALYRIPGIVVTAKGTVLAYCEARRNSRSDWGEIEVHLRRSTDGGVSWSPAQRIAHHGERIRGSSGKAADDEQQTVNNPVAIVDRISGSVEFLYCVNYARCFSIRSLDDGVSWSDPIEITATFEAFRPQCNWKVLATGPGHGIQLSSGRLLVPVWLAYGGVRDHHPSVTATIYSDDHGVTWKAGDVAIPDTAEFNDPNETIAAELSDGRVLLVARSESLPNRKLLLTSPDGASNWTPPRFQPELLEPICMAGLLAVPGRPGTLLFSNPATVGLDEQGRERPNSRGKREKLTIRLSTDNGATWPASRVLEPGKSAYSDLAALPDGTVLCFCEVDNRLRLARFSIDWVTRP